MSTDELKSVKEQLKLALRQAAIARTKLRRAEDEKRVSDYADLRADMRLAERAVAKLQEKLERLQSHKPINAPVHRRHEEPVTPETTNGVHTSEPGNDDLL